MRVVKKFKKKFECFTINNNRIYLGNSNQVDVYCLKSDLNIEILKFNNLITCVIVQDDYLYTGSINGDVKIWCLKTNQ